MWKRRFILNYFKKREIVVWLAPFSVENVNLVVRNLVDRC